MAKTFTVNGAATGKVHALCIDITEAAGWAKTWGGTRRDIDGLAVGGEWRSHEDARGITIRRVS
jgi:hypothetical protein